MNLEGWTSVSVFERFHAQIRNSVLSQDHGSLHSALPVRAVCDPTVGGPIGGYALTVFAKSLNGIA